jgi:uncharacterized membrane-anchored protein YjiN (DUF445 family)
MKKRYQKTDNQFKTYNDFYCEMKVKSSILNKEVRPSVHSVFYDENTLKTTLKELTGAALPDVLRQLDEVELQFLQQNIKRSNIGLPELEQPIGELLEQRLKLQAKNDVLEEEISFLEKQLARFSDKVTDEINELAKNSKPYGKAVIKGGYIVEIDNLPVSRKGSVSFIDCKASIYDGISCADYYKLSKQWLISCQAQAVANKQKAIAEGLRYELLSTGLRQGTNCKLPPVPPDCVNYKKETILTT